MEPTPVGSAVPEYSRKLRASLPLVVDSWKLMPVTVSLPSVLMNFGRPSSFRPANGMEKMEWFA